MDDQKAPIVFFDAGSTEPAGNGLLNIDVADFDFRLVIGQQKVLLAPNQTHFGFVYRGETRLCVDQRSYPLCGGMHFTAAGSAVFESAGLSIIVSQINYQGLFHIGGPIENEGRLRYIDGCSDTLLISPTVKGDACLNFLKIPPCTNQTFHTHPSFRFGMIVDGSGYCDSPAGIEKLEAGKVFFIPANGQHRFRTETDSLSVIAFHPDSDFGPEDDNHPMVNKTIVDGIPAAQLSHQQRGISVGDRP